MLQCCPKKLRCFRYVKPTPVWGGSGTAAFDAAGLRARGYAVAGSGGSVVAAGRRSCRADGVAHGNGKSDANSFPYGNAATGYPAAGNGNSCANGNAAANGNTHTNRFPHGNAAAGYPDPGNAATNHSARGNSCADHCTHGNAAANDGSSGSRCSSLRPGHGCARGNPRGGGGSGRRE